MYALFFFLFIGFSIFAMLIMEAIGIWPVWGGALFAFIFGICTYIFSMLKYRELSAIRDTATSKIGSLPMGFVEICGKARKHPHYHSIYHILEVKEVAESKKSSYRSGIGLKPGLSRSEFSMYPFYIDDGTGVALVNPKDAKMIVDTKKWYENGYVYEESVIKDGDEVYCIGTAGNKSKDLQSEIHKALKEARSDKYFVQKYDTDYDGKISQKEWENARKKIAGSVIESSFASNNSIFTVIGKGAEKKLFIISNKSEKELTSRYLKKTAGLLVIGIAAVAGAMLDAFMKLGVFPEKMFSAYTRFLSSSLGVVVLVIAASAIIFGLFYSTKYAFENPREFLSSLFKS